MASADRLLLLLIMTTMMMSSSFALSRLSAAASSERRDEHALQKRGKLETAGEYIEKIQSILDPVIDLIPVAGPTINHILKVTSIILKGNEPDATTILIKTEFDNLNFKIDQFHVATKWAIWASTCSQYEVNINRAYDDFQTLIRVCNDPKVKKEEKLNRINLFKKDYKAGALTAVKDLHKKLTTQQMSPSGFRKLLTDYVRCHEKEIRDFSLLINKLLYRGNTVRYFYSQMNGVPEAGELAQKAFESISLMYQIHKDCIINADKYIKQDILGIIENSSNRKQLAKDVRMHLEKAYSRYDWIAVAFITRHSKHTSKFRKPANLHTVTSFFEVTKGEVSVAVARQLKGSHSKATAVRQAIEKCVPKSTACNQVEDKLRGCAEAVDRVKVGETITAVHAYIDKAHDSFNALDAKQAPEPLQEDESVDPDTASTVPYVYTGKCTKYFIFPLGHYRVLIKSDEEIQKVDPCSKKQCGGPGKGKCVVLEKTLVAVCECEAQRYGVHCEDSVDGYKDNMIRENTGALQASSRVTG